MVEVVNLPEFVLARVAERARAAQTRDLHEPIHFIGCYYYEHTLDVGLYCDCDENGEATTKALAECRAIQLIAERAIAATGSGEHALQTAEEYARAQAFEDILEFLAAPYADHPDYNPDWRPL